MGSLRCISSGEQLAVATQPCTQTQSNQLSFFSLSFIIIIFFFFFLFFFFCYSILCWHLPAVRCVTAFVSSAILGCIYMYKITQQEGTKSLVCGPTVYKNKPMKEKCKCEKKGGAGQSRGHVKCVHAKKMLLHLRNTDSLEKLYLPQTMSKPARKHFMQMPCFKHVHSNVFCWFHQQHWIQAPCKSLSLGCVSVKLVMLSFTKWILLK